MKNKYIIAMILSLIFITGTKAMDYLGWWKDTHQNLKNFWAQGMIDGLTWGNAMEEIKKIENKDARQRMMSYVYANIDKVDNTAVIRVMNDFYNDSANSQLHIGILFFPAAAKLLGYPEEEIKEGLEILRKASVNINK
jgi:hypothetical protein